MKGSGPIRRRERQALLLGALIIIPSFVFARGLPAVHRWEQREAARWSELRADLERMRRATDALRAAHSGSAAERDEINALRRSLVTAATVAEAAGELADYVNGIALFSGASIRSVVLRGDSTFVGGTARLVLQLSVATDTEGVLAILRELAVGPRQVAVQSVAITQTDPGAPQDRPEALSVEFTVESVILRTGEWP